MEENEMMMKSTIKYMIARILEYAAEAKEDGNLDKRIAYVEVLNVMQAEIGADGYDIEEFGLDFIPEKMLL